MTLLDSRTVYSFAFGLGTLLFFAFLFWAIWFAIRLDRRKNEP